MPAKVYVIPIPPGNTDALRAAFGSEYARWIADAVFPLLGTEHLAAAEILADWRGG